MATDITSSLVARKLKKKEGLLHYHTNIRMLLLKPMEDAWTSTPKPAYLHTHMTFERIYTSENRFFQMCTTVDLQIVS